MDPEESMDFFFLPEVRGTAGVTDYRRGLYLLELFQFHLLCLCIVYAYVCQL